MVIPVYGDYQIDLPSEYLSMEWNANVVAALRPPGLQMRLARTPHNTHVKPPPYVLRYGTTEASKG